jgi:hypothetical protein
MRRGFLAYLREFDARAAAEVRNYAEWIDGIV